MTAAILPAQRLPAAAAMSPGRIVAVASGKGGVGKTWLAITLAHALTLSGRRVLLVDGDLGLANVDIQLGLLPEADLGDVLSGRLSVPQAVTASSAGFDVLAGRSGSGTFAALDEARLAALTAALRSAASRWDFVLLDIGAGIDAAVQRLTGLADLLLLVLTDEPTSLTDAYAVLKLHVAAGFGLDGVRVAVNQAASRAAGERTFATLARASTNFLHQAPALAGVIRRDERVREAVRRQTPLLARTPASPAAQDISALAATLLEP